MFETVLAWIAIAVVAGYCLLVAGSYLRWKVKTKREEREAAIKPPVKVKYFVVYPDGKTEIR